jgi:hypothetical protein
MVNVSNYESVRRNEISLLATAETLIFTIFIYFLAKNNPELIYYLLICIAFGWTLLLRTDISVQRGLLIYNWTRSLLNLLLFRLLNENIVPNENDDQKFNRKNNFSNNSDGSEFIPEYFKFLLVVWSKSILLILGYISFYLFNTLFSVVAKVIATIWTLFDHPVQTLSEIPINWRRHAFCIDFNHPVEFVPGYLDHLTYRPINVFEVRGTLKNPCSYPVDFLERRPLRNFRSSSQRNFYTNITDSAKLDDIRWQSLKNEFCFDTFIKIIIPFLVFAALINPGLIIPDLGSLARFISNWFGPLAPLVFPISILYYLLIPVFYGFMVPYALKCFFTTPLRIILFLPAYLYRFSLKGTFIAYFPLTYYFRFNSIRRLNHEKGNADDKLRLVKDILLDGCGLTIFISIIILVFEVAQVTRFNEGEPFLQFLCDSSTVCDFQGGIYTSLWAYTSLINAIISLVIICYLQIYIRAFRFLPNIKFFKIDTNIKVILVYMICSGVLGIYSFSVSVAYAHNIYSYLPKNFHISIPEMTLKPIKCIFPGKCFNS